MRPVFIVTLFALYALCGAGCRTKKESVSESVQSNTQRMEFTNSPQMLASIERTACYGQCPMYKATFLDNGEVIYVGKRFVENVGTYKTLISGEEVLDIKKKITEYDYFGLDSLYPTPIADFPSCITEASLNGTSKRVVDRRNPPDNLKAFERFLDGLLEERVWEKLSDDTDYRNMPK